jgi:predicted metal-dependent HD superfamily phosphohydrolase
MTALALPALWRSAGGSPTSYAVLAHRYAEPHRAYHTLAHATAVARELSEEGAAVVLAAACHDVVYDGRPGSDEGASAHWARTWLARDGVPLATVERVAELVLLTAGHVAPAGDRGAAALLDADLAVLAAPSPAYDAYVAAVRKEYGFLTDEQWRAGRLQVLRGLLGRPALFTVRAEREEPARANLARELAGLTQP